METLSLPFHATATEGRQASEFIWVSTELLLHSFLVPKDFPPSVVFYFTFETEGVVLSESELSTKDFLIH